MKYIIGKKIEMTQFFTESGRAVSVTKVKAGPCIVVQVKTDEKDGYSAVQFGYGIRKEKNINKPQLGHMKGLDNFHYLRELRIKHDKDKTELKRGDVINVLSFKEGDKIDVTSKSKGRGFQGVVKRYGFHGSLATHGHKDQLRMPGSIGATGPAHVFKGTRMGGHMGDTQVTTKNLEIVKIDEENNILYVKGAVSGARNSLVVIKGEGDMMVVKSSPRLAEQGRGKKLKVESTTTNDDEKKSNKDEIKKEENTEEIKEEKKVEEKKDEVKEDEPKEKVEDNK